jgi:hypothetical protein
MSNNNGLIASSDVAGSGNSESVYFLRKGDPVVIDDLVANNITCDTLDLNGGLLTTTTGGTILTLNGIPVGGIATITGTAPINVTAGANPIVSLNTSGVVPGTYPLADVTVNSQGLITTINAGTVPPNDDWSNFPAQTNVNMNNFLITSLATPVNATDATTKLYVDTLDAQNVKLTGNQTIAGIKTFNDIPVCATMPTNNDQLANKQYVDSAISADTLANVLVAGNSAGANQINMNNNKIINCADPTLAQDVATKNYVDALPAETLTATLIAGNSAGANTINMNNNQINNCADPLLPQDVATKIYVDTRPAESLSATLIAGNSAGANQINMNSNKIINCLNPTNPQDVATKNYVDNAIPGTPTLAQVLTAGNTANMDINMNDYDISSVNDITMSGLAPTITATNVLGNLTLSALGTFNALTGGQMTLASGGIMSIGGATYTTLENLRINNSVITKEPGQPDLSISDVTTLNMVGSGNINFATDTLINNTTGVVKINSVAPATVALPNILSYDPVSHEVKYQANGVITATEVNGTYTVQSGVITTATGNDTRPSFINNGINTSSVFSDLQTGTNTNIPYFNRNGSPFPNSPVNVGSTPFGSFNTPPDSSYKYRAMDVNTLTGEVYYGCYNPGSNESMIYTFNPSSNTWSQFIYMDGEIMSIFYDKATGFVWYGGAFTQSGLSPGGLIATTNVGAFTGAVVFQPQTGLNNRVRCFARWNGYIAIGGDFNADNSGSGNLYEFFVLYDPNVRDFFNIGQINSTVPGQFGFNDSVYTLAVLPQTNTLAVGGRFNQQYYAGTTTGYAFATRYELLIGFDKVGDGSISGNVYKLLADYEGKRLYIFGAFGSSVGNDFIAMPINAELSSPFTSLSYSLSSSTLYSTLTKDEVGGFIWLFNTNTGENYRYDPQANTYEDMDAIIGIGGTPSAGVYNPYDKAIHIGTQSGDTVYRYFCDQRIKLSVPAGEFIRYDGTVFDTVVLPKKGSTVTLQGISGNGIWSVLSDTEGVYYEWAVAQKKQVEPAYATALCLESTLTGIGSPTIIPFTTLEGRNIALSTINSGKIVVGQKGLYKMSFSAQLDNSGGGTIDAYIWFVINGFKYQYTNTFFTVDGPNSETAPYVEVIVELNAGDYVGLVVDSPSGSLDIPTFIATPTRPAIPGVIFNIQMIQPSTQFYS